MNNSDKPIRLNIDPEYLKDILETNPNSIFSCKGLLIKISLVDDEEEDYE